MTKKQPIKIGNAAPKSKIDQFKDRLAKADVTEPLDVEEPVKAPVVEDTSQYLPPASVRKCTPPPPKKNTTPTGKLDFSSITPNVPEVTPLFDISRYLKK